MNSKNPIRHDDSDMSTFASIILSGHIVEFDSRGSTENSYKTAQTTSIAEDSSLADVSPTFKKSEVACCFIKRAVNFDFEPQPELDLTTAIVKDSYSDTNKDISNGGVSEFKKVASSARTNGCTTRDRDTSEPRVDWNIFSCLNNASTFVDDKTIETNDNVCKFIRDESMPEWAPSLCLKSILCTSKYPEDNDFAKIRKADTIVGIPRVLYTSRRKTQKHDAEPKNISSETSLNIFPSTLRENRAFSSPGLHISLGSTLDFEKLEEYVEGLPSSPTNPLRNLRRSVSTSDLCEHSSDKLAMNHTLYYTNSLAFDTFDSHCGQGAQERKEPSLLHADRDAMKEPTVNEDAINEVELSTSLLIEWRKKRQRCFDTAMKLQEIVLESKSINNDNSKVSDPYVDPSNEFIKTITTPSEYQNCIASLHRNINFKQTEVTIADSGIDALSISRTLRSSDKKLCNESSPKSQQSEEYLASRLNKTRLVTRPPGETVGKIRSGSNLERLLKIEQRAPRSIDFQAISQEESTLSPSNVKYNRGCSRLHFDENCSPTRQIPLTIRYSPPEPMRHREYSNNSPPILSDRKQCGRFKIDVPKTTPQKARSPGRNFMLPLSPVSPSMINHNKGTIKKMTVCRTESCPVTVHTANSPQRKFFVTPGKPVQMNSNGKKRIFFPNININNEDNKDLSRQVTKGLRTPDLHRLGYKTVISPVSMYIHGTDTNLIQNKHEKKNEMLLSPSQATLFEDNLQFRLSGNTLTPRCMLQNDSSFAYKEFDANDENIQKSEFSLPKATYRLPAQVRTVNENLIYNSGARTRRLLQSTQNRVVIRHEGKRSDKNYDNKLTESGSNTADISVHVERPAKKTNYMSHWK